MGRENSRVRNKLVNIRQARKNQMNVEEPKVFISYSWSKQKTQDNVMELATRLMHDGVEVILDKWDLKEGHDKYVFMESCVSDESIDRVLIICDQAYQEKADDRKGGVGDETVVISPEVYGNMKQTKFIPLIFERDANNEPFTPIYLKSKKYIDFSNEDEYENAYEELLRILFDMPINKKPKKGSKPAWLNNDEINHSELKILTKALKRGATEQAQKYKAICTDFTDNFVFILNEFRFPEDKFNEEELIKKISNLKPVRDEYFDFLGTALKSEFFSTDFVINFFERIYNDVGNITNGGYTNSTFEYYNFFRWESFIGTIAILMHYEKYKEIHKILNHTYFLKEYPFKKSTVSPRRFIEFRTYLEMLEVHCQKKINSRYFSYTAQLLSEREQLPILSKQTFAQADLLLYQLSTIFFPEKEPTYYSQKWFPDMYIYIERTDLWIKLKSRTYCQKIMPLFGAQNISELKNLISRATHDNRMHHNMCYQSAPNILSYITLEQIASLE